MADCDARQDDGAMANPDVMADDHTLLLAHFTETLVDLAADKIFIGPVGDLVLRHTLHGVIEGVDADISCNGAELADGRVDHFTVPFDVGVIANLTLCDPDTVTHIDEFSKRAVTMQSCGVNAWGSVTAGFGGMALRFLHRISITKKPFLAERLFRNS